LKDPDELSQYPADIRDLAKMVNRGTIPTCGGTNTSGGCTGGTCSNVRFKHSMVRLGTSPRGIPFYSSLYKQDNSVVDLDTDATIVVAMAHDLIALAPEAVVRQASRWLQPRVGYSKIDVRYGRDLVVSSIIVWSPCLVSACSRLVELITLWVFEFA
jgi:hypothetical protein